MQRCAPIVTGEIGKEFVGECWTYNISVSTKLQLKIVQVLYRNFSFCVSRANLRKKKHDVFTLQFSGQP